MKYTAFILSGVVSVFILFSPSHAQFTHTFTQTARNTHYGSANAVAVDSGGTVFPATDDDGLIAYTYAPLTGIEDNVLPVPANYSLRQNYPNPFNPSTTIEFAIPKTGYVTLTIYNVAGEKVATLVSENLTAGSYKYQFGNICGEGFSLEIVRLCEMLLFEGKKIVLNFLSTRNLIKNVKNFFPFFMIGVSQNDPFSLGGEIILNPLFFMRGLNYQSFLRRNR